MFKIIFIAAVFISGFFYWQSLNFPADKSGLTNEFTVNQGESAKRVAENLKKENLIRSDWYFRYLVKRGRLNLKAGGYPIAAALTTREIIKILTLGDAIAKEKTITIIEGWNINDINNYLNSRKIIQENSFISLARQKAKEINLKIKLDEELAGGLPEGADFEGFLFPDTYRLNEKATAQEVIEKTLSNFNNKIKAEMRQEIRRQGKTVYEIITMASLIEKEVRTEDDMKIVSGIFWDRIKNGQGLESCATLAYVLGVNKGQYSLEDTRVDSLYNTYKYRGLPPGPIANPGLKAIIAAIYPQFTSYNYFLSDPATGRTIYSKTLEEHNRNKVKYLK